MDEHLADSDGLLNGDCFLQSAMLESSNEESLLNAVLGVDGKDSIAEEPPSSIVYNFGEEAQLLEDPVETGFSFAKDVFDGLEEGKGTPQDGPQRRESEVTSQDQTSSDTLSSAPKKLSSRRGRIAKKSLASKPSSSADGDVSSNQKRTRRYSPVFIQHQDPSEDVLTHIDGSLVKKATSTVLATYSEWTKQKHDSGKKEYGDNEAAGSGAGRTAASKKQKSSKSSQKVKVERTGSTAASVDSKDGKRSSASKKQEDKAKQLSVKTEETQRGKRRAEEPLCEPSTKKTAPTAKDRRASLTESSEDTGCEHMVSVADKSSIEVAKMFGLKDFNVVVTSLTEKDFARYEAGELAAADELQQREIEKDDEEVVEKNAKKKKSKPVKPKDLPSPDPDAASVSKSFQDKDTEDGSSVKSTRTRDLDSVAETISSSSSRKEKKRFGPETECSVCHRKLSECVEDWQNSLGSQSAYCSRDCIEKQVEITKEVVKDEKAQVILLAKSGVMLSGLAAPTVGNLLEFLYGHAEFTPILPTHSAKKAGSSTDKESSKTVEASHKESKSDKVFSKETDQRRFQVKRAIADKLVARAKKTPSLSFTTPELKNLAQKIEEQLFKECKQNITGRYRSWFKQFILNLSNETNKGFYLRVLLGDISVQKLVSLDSSGLSSPGLADPIEIPESRKCVKAVNGENGTKLEKTDSKEDPVEKGKTSNEGSQKDETASSPAVKKPSLPSAPKKKSSVQTSEVDKILGMEPTNTTENHRYHLFDLNCDICTGKKERELQERKRKNSDKNSEAKLKRKMAREAERKLMEPSTSSWREAVASTSDAPPTVDKTTISYDDIDDVGFQMDDDDEVVKDSYERSRTEGTSWRLQKNDRDYEEKNLKNESWRSSWKGSETGEISRDTWRQERNERQRSPLGAKEKIVWEESGNDERWDNSESRSRYIMERKPRSFLKDERKSDPRKGIESVDLLAEEEERTLTLWELEERHIVWTGVLTMGQYFQFTTTMTALSNEKAFRLREELPPVIRIIGRIAPLVVFDYLLNLRKSKAKDVIVLQLDRPVNPDMEQRFTKCFMDMQKKKRYSVLELNQQPMIKDGYLIALRRGEEAPAVLLPYDGPGIPDDHGDIIICVIVRHKDAFAADSFPVTPSKPKKEPIVIERRLRAEFIEKPVVEIPLEIPLEPIIRSTSPGTCMREFEASLEGRSPLFNPTISPTMVHARAFRPSSPEPQSRPSEDAIPKKNIPLFGSPKAEDEKLWGGIEEASSSSSQADSLLPPGFFDRLQKLPPVRAPLPSITSISDLLVAIHTHTQPSEISQLVADFIHNNVLQPGEQQLIEKAVEQKVRLERKKRGEIVEDEEPEASSSSKLKKGHFEEAEKDTVNDEDEDLFDAKQFESEKSPTTFVGTKESMAFQELDFKADSGMEMDTSSPLSAGGGSQATPSSTPGTPPLQMSSVPLPAPTIDLNTCAPPPPPPPPLPPASNPFSPTKTSIPLPPPPVPPPQPPNIFGTVVPTPVPVIQRITPLIFSPMMSNTSGTPVNPTGTSGLSFPSPMSQAQAVPYAAGSMPSKAAEHGRTSEGEMDMDISDDEGGQSSPPKKSSAARFLPPPPPPPKFSVPLPQPPPMANLSMLSAPPVPPPPPVPAPTSSASPLHFFNTPSIASPLHGVRPPPPSAATPPRPPVVPQFSPVVGVRPPSLPAAVISPAFGSKNVAPGNESVFSPRFSAQDSNSVAKQNQSAPASSPLPSPAIPKDVQPVLRNVGTDSLAKIAPAAKSFEVSSPRSSISEGKRPSVSSEVSGRISNEPPSRESAAKGNQRFVSYETGEYEEDQEMLDEDWDTGDYGHEEANRKLQFFDEGKQSTSTDYEEFDSGRRVIQSTRDRNWQGGSTFPRPETMLSKRNIAGTAPRPSSFFWGEDEIDNGSLPEWSNSSKRPEPPFGLRRADPGEGFFGFRDRDPYGNSAGPSPARSCIRSFPAPSFTSPGLVPPRYNGPRPPCRPVPFNGPSPGDRMSAYNNGSFPRGGSRGRGRRGQGSRPY